MAKIKGLTRQTSGTRKITVRDYGNNTTFSLYLPYSVGGSFSIGSVEFQNNGSNYVPVQAIPKSWYVNLNV